MPHTPGRKKLAAKDEASFIKRELGIAAGAVACHETNLGATSDGAIKQLHRLDRQVVALDFN